MDASRRPLRAAGRKGLSDARKRQIRGTRQPKPNNRAGATPRRYIATIVSPTRRGHHSRGKLGISNPTALYRATCPTATNAASRAPHAHSCETDDNQQSHRRQEVAARARRSGSLRPRSGRNAAACTANDPRSRCPACCSARPLPDSLGHARAGTRRRRRRPLRLDASRSHEGGAAPFKAAGGRPPDPTAGGTGPRVARDRRPSAAAPRPLSRSPRRA